ncbi:hypothetical protein HBB16_06695 [Pseudonocardia sp. MCCB 268]|nr:hypothetical protein [Pseudonocardia cytotoxica]
MSALLTTGRRHGDGQRYQFATGSGCRWSSRRRVWAWAGAPFTGPPGLTCGTARHDDGHPHLAGHDRGCSAVGLRAVLRTAGIPGMTHPFQLTVSPSDWRREHPTWRSSPEGDPVHPGRPLR